MPLIIASLPNRVSRFCKHLIASSLSCQADLTRISFELCRSQTHSAATWNAKPQSDERGYEPRKYFREIENEIYYKNDGSHCEYARSIRFFSLSILGPDSEICEGSAGVCGFATCHQAAAPEYQTWSLGERANDKPGGRVADPG